MESTEKINLPKDINAIKQKVIFGMTKRQLICFGMGALLGIPLFFSIKGKIGVSPAAAVMIFTMIPFFLLALYEKDKRTLEKIIMDIVRLRFLRPEKRLYKTCSLYERAEETMDTAREVKKIVAEIKREKKNQKQPS